MPRAGTGRLSFERLRAWMYRGANDSVVTRYIPNFALKSAANQIVDSAVVRSTLCVAGGIFIVRGSTLL
ncbi:hypothetical protein KCP77_17900 [Salmonella enterica subsp. enterica]|nr:hypothetical protein KCP77_17900 [Salmonella enterica subsp. enterica]